MAYPTSTLYVEPVNNANCTEEVLPSYSMYKSIMHKRLRHSGTNDRSETRLASPPPHYELLRSLTPYQSRTSVGTGRTVHINDIHTLATKRNPFITVHIKLTHTPSVIGVAPDVIDDDTSEGKEKEYSQDDYIYGFAIIENTSSQVIPFGMFYVLLEGVYQHDDKTTRKFVNMVDLNASLMNTELPQQQFDPVDETCLVMENQLQPCTKYKRFFTFRIPSNTLETACGHQVADHLKIPPSLGGQGKYRDYGVNYTWIKYAVNGYLLDEDKDKFVNVGSGTHSVRIVPKYTPSNGDLYASATTNYDRFFAKLKQELRSFNKEGFDKLIFQLYGSSRARAKNSHGQVELSVESPPCSHTIKYVPPIPNHPDVNQDIEVSIAISYQSQHHIKVKKVECELVMVTVESSSYSIPFTIEPQMIFGNCNSSVCSHSKYNVNYTHNNNPATFEDIVTKPYRKLFKEVKRLLATETEGESSTMANSGLSPGKDIYESVKQLSNLRCAYHELAIEDVEYKVRANQTPRPSGSVSRNTTNSVKTMSLNLKANLKSMHIKKLDKAVKSNRFGGFAIVPNFQNCYMARLYFCKITVQLASVGKQSVTVPIQVVS